MSNISDYWNKIESELAQLRSQNTALEAKVKELEATNKHMCHEWAEDDTEIKKLATPFIGDMEKGLDGEFCSIVTVVEMLCNRLSALEAILEQSQHDTDVSSILSGCGPKCAKCAFEALKKGESAK